MKHSKIVCVSTSILTENSLVIFVRRKAKGAPPTAQLYKVRLSSLRRLVFILNQKIKSYQKHTYVLTSGWTVHLLDRFA